MTPRHRRRTILLPLLAACSLLGQGRLEPHRTIDRQLASGQTDEYTLPATAGQFVHLIARQLGVDVVVTVLDPLGRTILQADRPNNAFGPEAVSFIAGTSGEFRIRVSAGSSSAGRYRMEFPELRQPTPADRNRIAAETLTFQAAREQESAGRQTHLHSIDLFERAALAWHGVGDSYEEGLALNVIGALYDGLGDKRKALSYYLRALPLSHASGDPSSEATVLNNIGIDYTVLGDMQPALDYCLKALPLRHAVGDRSGEAATLRNLGSVHKSLGQMPKALEYYNRALAICQADRDRSGEASTLNSIGSVYSTFGEIPKALDYYARALPLSRAAGNRSGEASILNNIGTDYLHLGEKPKAMDHFNQALPIFRALADRSGEATVLANMGSVYSLLGQKQEALKYYSYALPILHDTGNRAAEANTLDSIGGIYADLGDNRNALNYYGQALSLRHALGLRSGEAITLSNMGTVYRAIGDPRKALDCYGQALLLSRAVGDRSQEAITLGNSSRIFETSQPELAIFLCKQSVNLLQSIRRDNRTLDESLRKSYENSIARNYRYLAGLLVGRRRFGEAEEVLNLLKDKEAADFIRRDAVIDQLKSATLLDSERQALLRYEQILSRIVPEGAAKSDLVAKAANQPLSAGESQQAEQLDRDLAASNTVLLRYFADLEKTLADNSASSKRVGELRESEGLQDTLQALGPDVVAIYTLVLPDRYTALLISSGARKAYSTAIPEAELNRKIFDFRQQLQNPGSDPLPLARELYRIVFPEGLRQDLDAMGAKTIMWSIDSTLRYVPIAALHDGAHYLVSRFRNSLITPASLTRLTETSRTLWKGVGFGVSQAKGDFSALPAVPDELRRIFQQDAGSHAPVPGRVRLDPEFTRESFRAAMQQPDKSVVHIATHFASRPGVAANSHLLLGDGTELSLAEIEAMPRLFSGVDLLTLSACSTAFTNGAEDGREVDSFGTVAQRLGAKAVIASLWSVNDEATARLMETMYRIRQSKPELGKSEALRQAQDQMAAGVLKPGPGAVENRGVKLPVGRNTANAWTHPYYWAPFILIGNWK